MRAATETEEKCKSTYRKAAADVIVDVLKAQVTEANPLPLGILGCKSCEELLTGIKSANLTGPVKDQKQNFTEESHRSACLPHSLKLQTYGPDGSTTWSSEGKYFIRKNSI